MFKYIEGLNEVIRIEGRVQDHLEQPKEARSLCKSYPEKEQQDSRSQAISDASCTEDPTSHFQGKPNTSGNLSELARRQKIFTSTLMKGFPPNSYHIKCKLDNLNNTNTLRSQSFRIREGRKPI